MTEDSLQDQAGSRPADAQAAVDRARRRRHGVATTAHLDNDQDDDGAADWAAHEAEQPETSPDQAADAAPPHPAAPAAIVCDPLTSMGELLLRIVASRSGQKLWDGIVRAQDEVGIARTAQALATSTDRSLQSTASQLANIIAQERRKWLESRQAQERADPDNFLAGVWDSAAFASADCRRDWLVQGLLVRHEPVLIGGPKKSLKTSLIVDLAVSLGSGTELLHRFEVPHQVRTLVLSGESGAATLQETARRVCQAKQLALEQCDVRWGFRLPNLSLADDLAALGAYLKSEQVGVVIIDPLYLCLLQAGVPLATSNLFQTGPLLLQVATVCQEAGATPILVHHARKQTVMGKALGGYAALDLDDLAYSGFAEFARQWLLVSRRAAYEPGSGMHELWLNVGGSAGQGGLWGVNIEEGTLHNDFTGRRWQVEVLDRQQVDALVASDRHERRRTKEDADLLETRRLIMLTLRHNRDGETKNGLLGIPGVKKKLILPALLALQQENMIEPTTIRKPRGKGQGDYEAWKLSKGASCLLDASERSQAPPGPLSVQRAAKAAREQRRAVQAVAAASASGREAAQSGLPDESGPSPGGDLGAERSP